MATKFLLLVAFGLIGSVILALVLINDPGYVLLSYDTWTVETSLSLFVLAVLAVYFLFWLGYKMTSTLWHIPSSAGHWRNSRRLVKARFSLQQGMVALNEGRWRDAERELLRQVVHSEAPLLHYLAAARAAQQQGAMDRRDQYLKLAHEKAPSKPLAVGLTQAELQIAHHQMEQALATLTHLRSQAPKNKYLLRLLLNLYQELSDWKQLRILLPELRKHRVLDVPALNKLEKDVYRSLLEQAAAQADDTLMEQTWNQMSKSLRDDPDLLTIYVQNLEHGDRSDHAESLLRGKLNKKWDESLVSLYGNLVSSDPKRQLAVVEGWLKQHPNDAGLLLGAGRLCIVNQLWGKARGYLEASIGIHPQPQSLQVLAALLQHLGETDAAIEYYRKGLQSAIGRNTPVFPALGEPGSESGEMTRYSPDGIPMAKTG